MTTMPRHRQPTTPQDVAALALIAAATLAATVALAATAQADSSSQFQSPSGGITCMMSTGDDGQSRASCQVDEYTYIPPPKPAECHLNWGSQLTLNQGSAADFACQHQSLRSPGEQTLDYGQTSSVGAITCDSEPTGMTCTDTGTGHYFRISRESYDLG